MFYLGLFLSFIIVALGQPAFSVWAGLLTAIGGVALFWGITLKMSPRSRFWLSVAFMMGVQLIQLSWFLSHPYAYIYALWSLLSLLIGLGFGYVTLQVTEENLPSIPRLLGIAGMATLFEWIRLFILSGFSWNPIGLSVTGSVYYLQWASLFGVFGLSFWVYFTNLLLLRAYFFKKWIVYLFAVLIPLIFGIWQVKNHDQIKQEHKPDHLDALLVQTAFPIEETLPFKNQEEYKNFVLNEWDSIFHTLKKHQNQSFDLIALPEYVVPFGTYTPVFPEQKMGKMMKEAFGPDLQLHFPYAQVRGGQTFVSNADVIQTLSDHFQADVVVGLEDACYNSNKELEYFSSAFLFEPNKPHQERRYDKRVLVPMGEYIPFKFLQDLAKSYGIGGSFTCGKEAKVFEGKKGAFGLSICYEETYADLMRENKVKGAKYLVNLTSDVWYPNSRLPRQHLDHARLRCVEAGYPLLRACNTGVTCAVDANGRTLAELDGEWTRSALKVRVPLYSYPTLYAYTGDILIVGFSILMTFVYFLLRKLQML